MGIYVHESVNFEIREDLTIMEDKIFESLFIEIKGADRNFIHGTIYRSPNSDNDANNIFQEYLKKCLAKLKKSKKACFIQGDLNFNLIEVSDKHTESFTDIMFDNSFYPHINIPTRITATSATCIDHIWSNVYDSDIVCGVIPETIADHMITFQCSDILISKSHSSPTAKTFTKTDYDMVVPLLNSIDTEDIMNCNDLESAYSKLENRVSEVVQKCTTNISPKTKIDQPWYDHELKKLRIKRQRYHNILKR